MDAPYQLNAMEQLVWDSEISCNVLGKGERFVLISNPVDFSSPSLAIARESGFAYCGCVGYKAGECSAQVDPANPDALLTMLHASFAFTKFVATQVQPSAKDDSAEWCANLWKLEDPRA
jgi:hypothetical protein